MAAPQCYKECPTGYTLQSAPGADPATGEPHLCVPDDPTRGLLPISAPYNTPDSLKPLLSKTRKQVVGSCGAAGCPSYGCILDVDDPSKPFPVVACGNQAACQQCPLSCPSGYTLDDSGVLCVPTDSTKPRVSGPATAPNLLPVDQTKGEKLGLCSNCGRLGCVKASDGSDVIACDGGGVCVPGGGSITPPDPNSGNGTNGTGGCDGNGTYWGLPAKIWAIIAVVLAAIAVITFILGIIRFIRRSSDQRSAAHFLLDVIDVVSAIGDTLLGSEWFIHLILNGLSFIASCFE